MPQPKTEPPWNDNFSPWPSQASTHNDGPTSGPKKPWKPETLKLDCERARPLQRSLGPFRPEMPKKSRKCLPPGTPKSLQKVSGTVRKVSGECRKILLGLFPRLFGDFSGFRGRRPRETFSRLSGPKGSRDLCKGRARSPQNLESRNSQKILGLLTTGIPLCTSPMSCNETFCCVECDSKLIHSNFCMEKDDLRSL